MNDAYIVMSLERIKRIKEEKGKEEAETELTLAEKRQRRIKKAKKLRECGKKLEHVYDDCENTVTFKSGDLNDIERALLRD